MPIKELIGVLKRDKIVLGQARKNKEVVFGARALNKQVIGLFKRKTFDWDLYSKHPRKSARQMERKLDRAAGKNLFYRKKALHQGTIKVIHKGLDGRKNTRDDFGVVDYSKHPKKLKTVVINGIRYAAISSIKKDRLKALRDPNSAFRHRKDREDLNVIKGDKFLKEKIKI